MDRNLKWHDDNGKIAQLYCKWSHAKSRCYNKNNPRYKYYGARGITMCDEWRYSYRAFAEWAYDHGYRSGMSLDRIDNDRGYQPDNCRWVPLEEQKRNRRYCYHLEFKGREFCTLQEAADATGISQNTLTRRLKRGWPVELALGTPVGAGFKLRSTILKTQRRKFDKCAYCAMPQRSDTSKRRKSSRP